ncbi:hypothetical protein [Natranaerobius thermophilus]|uniref:Aminodeoxychorismate lyase n=1 Tax=Natranaerobius thermophilus (strain ATCC BAA-1301 / DSM 18059 / JW/NM-WN-LF) TaxID=457570 RepID=B2A379_NATTJ|nr:hypothetical protein [Natranaerobius thermophilus]ACB85009.1 hypothetical protein Nther_1426 [Natranaerobius thermophilus JW/NM-WN-LF]
MKLDPKILLGIGIGFVCSSLLFMISQPFAEPREPLQLEDNQADSDVKESSNQELDELVSNTNDTDSNNEQVIEQEKEEDINGLQEVEEKKEGNSGLDTVETEEVSDDHIIIEIPRGLAADEIAIVLEEKDIVEEAEEFVDLLVSEGKVTDLNYGKYQLPKDGDSQEIIQLLSTGP